MSKCNKGYCSTSTTGQKVSYGNQVYQEKYTELKIDKAVFMLLKKINKLEEKIKEIEINCSCQ